VKSAGKPPMTKSDLKKYILWADCEGVAEEEGWRMGGGRLVQGNGGEKLLHVL